MSDLDEIAELFRAGQPLPTSQVIDIDRAVLVGGRQRVRRRVLGGTAAVGVAAVALLAAFAVARGLGPTGLPPGPAGPSPSPDATTSTTAPVAFDPMRFRPAPGWVPANLTSILQESSAGVQQLTYAHYVPDSPDPALTDAHLTISVFAAGVAPDQYTLLGHRAVTEGVAGPTVNGGSSVWLMGADDSTYALGWHWAANGWAVVGGYGDRLGRGEALQGTILQVATRLTERDRAVAMPFTMDRPPAALRLVQTAVGTFDGGRVSGELRFSSATGWTAQSPPGLVVDVDNNPTTTGGMKIGYPNTIVDGHPARITFTDSDGWVDLFGVDGHHISLHVYDQETLRIVDKDATTLLGRGVRLVADPANLAGWTTSPLR